MDEYIAKAALYGEVAKLEELVRNRYLETPIISPAYTRYTAQMQDMTAFKHLIADFPAADVEPVKHGRWEKWDGDDRHHCKVCECYANADRDGYGYITFEFLDDYCPKCGAKMDEEVET